MGFDYKTPMVHLCSHASLKEFKSLFPAKIDRCDSEKLTFGKLFTHNFEKIRTTESWKKRRGLFYSSGVLKQPNSLVPLMASCLDAHISQWKEGQEMDFMMEFNNIALEIIVLAIFGEKIQDKMNKVRYIYKDGTCKYLDFTQTLQIIAVDIVREGQGFINSIAPWVNEKGLTKGFKIDQQNIDEIYKVLENYFSKNAQTVFDIQLLKVGYRILQSLTLRYRTSRIHQKAG